MTYPRWQILAEDFMVLAINGRYHISFTFTVVVVGDWYTKDHLHVQIETWFREKRSDVFSDLQHGFQCDFPPPAPPEIECNRGIHCEFQNSVNTHEQPMGVFIASKQKNHWILSPRFCIWKVLDLSHFILWVLFFSPADRWKWWWIQTLVSSSHFWKRLIWMSTTYLQKCSEMFSCNLQHVPTKLFKYNSIPNICFGLSFLRCLTSFQPFPMDASVASGGSGFLRWGW